jgi:hypothetical protein
MYRLYTPDSTHRHFPQQSSGTSPGLFLLPLPQVVDKQSQPGLCPYTIRTMSNRWMGLYPPVPVTWVGSVRPKHGALGSLAVPTTILSEPQSIHLYHETLDPAGVQGRSP